MNLIKEEISKFLAFDIIIGGHSTFNVEGRGVLKKRMKINRVRGFKPIFTFAL